MKILVTGANGQLGHEMRNVLEEKMPGVTLYTDIDELDLTDAKAVENYVIDNDVLTVRHIQMWTVRKKISCCARQSM